MAHDYMWFTQYQVSGVGRRESSVGTWIVGKGFPGKVRLQTCLGLVGPGRDILGKR